MLPWRVVVLVVVVVVVIVGCSSTSPPPCLPAIRHCLRTVPVPVSVPVPLLASQPARHVFIYIYIYTCTALKQPRQLAQKSPAAPTHARRQPGGFRTRRPCETLPPGHVGGLAAPPMARPRFNLSAFTYRITTLSILHTALQLDSRPARLAQLRHNSLSARPWTCSLVVRAMPSTRFDASPLQLQPL